MTGRGMVEMKLLRNNSNNPSSHLVQITPSLGGDEPSTAMPTKKKNQNPYITVSTNYTRQQSKHTDDLRDSPLGVKVDDAHVFELLQDVAGEGTTALAEVRRA
jgi:hypothetical protein